MASWRDSTSLQAQADLDGLLASVLPFAEQTIAKHGEMYPFGTTVTTDGELTMLAADPGAGEHPPSQEVLAALHAGARKSRERNRAVAFAMDVTANGADAVRIELDHSEGTALAVLVPYTRNRFTKRVTLGEFGVARGERRIWVG